MKLSVVLPTKDRAHAVGQCLDSIAAAISNAGLLDAEIIVVNNGSTDETAEKTAAWANRSGISTLALTEPRVGKSRALNHAVAAASGDLLAFTDDDCRLQPDHISDLLRHAAGDMEPMVRGGRTELGDPTDLPLTITTEPERILWSRHQHSARHQAIAGQINGCNLTMPRAIIEKIGPFDERLGPGTVMEAGEDTDLLFRAYLAYITLEYVPDMTVRHFHGRKTEAQGRKLLKTYLQGNGAEMVKHGWRDPDLCRPFLWDCKNAVGEILKGGTSTTFIPYFTHRDKVVYAGLGALKYVFAGMHYLPHAVWEERRGVSAPTSGNAG